MLSLTRMYLYRLLRSRSMLILLATVVVVLSGLHMLTLPGLLNAAKAETGFGNTKENLLPGQISLSIEITPSSGDVPPAEGMTVDYLLSELFASDEPVLCVIIFGSLFLLAEKKSGFEKNIACVTPGSAQLLLARFLTLAVECLLILLEFCVFGLLFGMLAFGTVPELVSLSAAARLLTVHFVFLMSAGSVIMALLLVFKNMTLIVLLLLAYSYVLIPMIANQLPVWFLEYIPVINAAAVTLNMGNTAMFQMLFSGMAYIILSFLVSLAVMRRRDIA